MAERVGLDLAPVNPFSDDEALWLLACLWPDNLARFERLRAALANVRAAAQPPRLERGDLLTDLSHVVATMPGDGPLVVFHSWVAAYLGEEEQRTLAEQVAALGERRPVHYLYCESPFETPGLPTPLPRCDARDRIWQPRWSTWAPEGPSRAPGRHPPARVLDPLVASVLTSHSAIPALPYPRFCEAMDVSTRGPHGCVRLRESHPEPAGVMGMTGLQPSGGAATPHARNCPARQEGLACQGDSPAGITCRPAPKAKSIAER